MKRNNGNMKLSAMSIDNEVVDYKVPLLTAIRSLPNKLTILEATIKANNLRVKLKPLDDNFFIIEFGNGVTKKVSYIEAFIKTRSLVKYIKRKTGAI